MGRVVAITDGDTLTILTTDRVQHRVRLAGIDTPEKRQPFGQVAKNHPSSLVNGQTVTVNYYKRDRYGRIVGKVLTNGADADLRQIEAGLAWHYKQYQNEQNALDRARYATAETEARRRDAACGHCRQPKGCRPGNGVTAAGGRLKPHPLSAPRPAARSDTAATWCRVGKRGITWRRAGLPDWMATAMAFLARRCAMRHHKASRGKRPDRASASTTSRLTDE